MEIDDDVDVNVVVEPSHTAVVAKGGEAGVLDAMLGY